MSTRADRQEEAMTIRTLLEQLHLEENHLGACIAPDQWLAAEDGEPLPCFNPTTGEMIARVRPADGAIYDAAIRSSQAAFERWRDVPAPQRGQLVRDLGQALREIKEPLGELIALETGKIREEGLGEVQEMIDVCDLAVGMSRQLYGRTMPSERPDHRMAELWHPLGVVGVVSAFNFPVAVWSWNAAVAAVCGDSVIWKPSSSAALSAVAVQHLCNRVTADHGQPGLFNLVVGPGSSVGERMAADPRVPLISFTGSTRRGRHVAEVVAGRLGRTILELGGNNAIVVSEQADLEMATRAILFGAVGTTGQRCTSTRRVIAHSSVVDALSERLIRGYRQVRIGDPLDSATLMGPLLDGYAVDRMFQTLEEARVQGGEILHGGERLPELGPNFVEPTLIRMPSQTEVVRKETFAPILYLLSYDTLAEAIALHNGVPQGLSSAIFTRDMREAERFLSQTGSDCGIANVNIGTSGAEIGGAFGGEKETGGGREAGSDAWKGYMRRQTTTINYGSELPLAQGIAFDL
jgi:aldehyde dehydrogenase (NAD+)